MKVEIKNLPKSEIEITGEIPFSDLEIHKEKALNKLGANLDLAGFRKGHIPEKVVREKIGEPRLLNEMAEMALGNAYPKIIIEHKIDPIAHPEITITKIAMNNPLGFKIKVPVMPDIKLPDYKEISEQIRVKKEDVVLKKEDIEVVINQILESKKDKDGKKPELTNELVKTLGDFKDLEDFNKKVEDGVKKEKEWKEKEKIRIQIMEEVINKSDIELPNIVIESELEKMIAQFKGDITRMGLNVDDYLKNTGKTIENLRVEWRGEAEKRGKSQLILNKIAIEEKIYPKAEEVEKEAEHLMSHHPSTRSTRSGQVPSRNNGQAKLDENRVKVYVETILTNEKVMEFLENPKIEKRDKKE